MLEIKNCLILFNYREITAPFCMHQLNVNVLYEYKKDKKKLLFELNIYAYVFPNLNIKQLGKLNA